MSYELRTLNNPKAMPGGDSTISVHNTPEEATAALNKEADDFAASPYSTGGSYLQRVVVEVDPDGYVVTGV